MRKASWISSPTVRSRRLPKCSYSSRWSWIGSRGPGAAPAAECVTATSGSPGVPSGLGRVARSRARAGQADELADQREDVVMGQDAGVEVDVQAQAAVELVAADARQVVALRVEEELMEQRARVVDARRLAGALLLEELDERALLGLRQL